MNINKFTLFSKLSTLQQKNLRKGNHAYTDEENWLAVHRIRDRVTLNLLNYVI